MRRIVRSLASKINFSTVELQKLYGENQTVKLKVSHTQIFIRIHLFLSYAYFLEKTASFIVKQKTAWNLVSVNVSQPFYVIPCIIWFFALFKGQGVRILASAPNWGIFTGHACCNFSLSVSKTISLSKFVPPRQSANKTKCRSPKSCLIALQRLLN